MTTEKEYGFPDSQPGVTNAGDVTQATRHIIVHHADHEGGLLVDAFTGNLITPPLERPDWAEGLAQALLGERLEFYSKRLGKLFTDEMKLPTAIAFADLSWVAVNEQGLPEERAADDEHRMSIIAEITGVTRPDNLNEDEQYTGGTVTAATELDIMSAERTDDEFAALEESQREEVQKSITSQG